MNKRLVKLETIHGGCHQFNPEFIVTLTDCGETETEVETAAAVYTVIHSIADVAQRLGFTLDGVAFGPSPDPTPNPGPIALLAEGKRLRYVRDPESDCVPPWNEVECYIDINDAPRYCGVITHRAPVPAVFTATCRNMDQVAVWTHRLAVTLGYRFEEVVS